MNELKVGLLTVGAICAFVFMSLRVAVKKDVLGSYIEYSAIVDDATGIFERSAIRVAGIKAGRILSIDLQDSRALIRFEVTEKIKITSNSILQVKSVGFLGDKYLDIFLGNPSAPRLESGSMLTSKTGGSIDELAKDASDILKDVKDALKDEQGRNVLTKIVRNIRDITKDVKEMAARLNTMTKDNEGRINKIVEDVERISAQLAFETDRYSDGSLMNDMERVGPILEDVKIASGDLKDIIADVKAGKGTVGKLLRDEETIDKVNETLAGVSKLVGKINSVEAEVSVFTGINTDNGNHTQLDLDLYTAPERFFRLGLVTNSFGPEVADEKTVTTEQAGQLASTTKTREVDDGALKYNLQIGRRLQNFMIRAGLIETTGGIGFDYIYDRYGFRSSLEIFDWDEDVGPNVRLQAEMRIWNVLYTRISGEDLVSSGNQTATISAGLRFTDQDLASLVGLIAN